MKDEDVSEGPLETEREGAEPANAENTSSAPSEEEGAGTARAPRTDEAEPTGRAGRLPEDQDRVRPTTPDDSGVRFAGAGPTIGPPVYSLIDLAGWRSDQEIAIDPTELPDRPGLYLLHSADVRAIAAAVRPHAAAGDVVLDLGLAAASSADAREDDRKLLALLEAHRGLMSRARRIAVYPGDRGFGTQFWDEDIDVARIDEFCRNGGHVVLLAAVGAASERFTSRATAPDVIEVDPWPLIRTLVAQCPGTDEARLREAWPQLVRLGLVGSLIRALDSRAAEEVLDLLETVRDSEPLVREASDFVAERIVGGEPATMATAFAVATFGELMAGELREFAGDLVQAPDLIEAPWSPSPDDKPRPPRTRIDDRTLLDVGIVRRERRADDTGARSTVMTLRNGPLLTQAIRRVLPDEAPMTSAKFVEQMSSTLVHGAVRPSIWKAGSEVVARVLLNEGDTSPGAVAARAADYWLALNRREGSVDRRRAQRLADSGEPLIDELCSSLAEASGLDRRQLQAQVAVELVVRAAASSVVEAWRAPAAAAFGVRLLGTLDDIPAAERVIDAWATGPEEVATLAAAMLTGGFGFTSVAEADTSKLDRLLLTFLEISGEQRDRLPKVRSIARRVSHQLLALRLAADAARVIDGGAPTVSSALAEAMLAFAASTEDAADPGADWMAEETFDHLSAGWRRPPELYRQVEPGERGDYLRAEASYQMSIRAVLALTGAAGLGEDSSAALDAFCGRLASTPPLSIDLAALWLPSGPGRTDGGTEAFSGPDDDDDSGFHADFIGTMRTLRSAVPLLACAFAQTSVDGEVQPPALHAEVRPPAVDRAAWRRLAASKERARDVLDYVGDSWRDVASDIRRSSESRAVFAEVGLRRRILTTWWSALQSARASAI